MNLCSLKVTGFLEAVLLWEFRGASGTLGGQVNDQRASGDEGTGVSFDTSVTPVQNALTWSLCTHGTWVRISRVKSYAFTESHGTG